MSYQLILLEEVRDEISSAYAWYEDKKAGLGDEFLDELERAFTLLETKT